MSHERLEQKRRVKWPAGRLGVELHGEEGLADVNDALVRTIIGVDEERLPALR